MLLSEIKKVIGTCAEVRGDDHLDIHYLLTDSRELKQEKASTTLFFCHQDSRQ